MVGKQCTRGETFEKIYQKADQFRTSLPFWEIGKRENVSFLPTVEKYPISLIGGKIRDYQRSGDMDIVVHRIVLTLFHLKGKRISSMNTVLQQSQPIVQISFVSVSVPPENHSENRTDEMVSSVTRRFVTSLEDYINADFLMDNENETVLLQDHKDSKQDSGISINSVFCSSFNPNFNINNSFNTLTISPSLRSAYTIKKATSFRNIQSLKYPQSYDERLSDSYSSTSRTASISSSNLTSLLSYKSSLSSYHSIEIHPLSVNTKKFIRFSDETKEGKEEENENEEKGYGDDDNDENELDININNYDSSNECNCLPSHPRSTSINIKYESNNTTTNTSLKETNPRSTSNITSFLKKMKSSINKSLDLNPISNNANQTVLNHNSSNIKLHQIFEVPLETFSQKFEKLPTLHENIEINSPNNDGVLAIHFFGKTRRIRENRINSKYLLLYSIDNSIRLNGYLNQFTDEEIDIFDDLLLEKYNQISVNFDSPSNEQIFDGDFGWKLESRLLLANNLCFNSNLFNSDYINNIKLASIARFKLWSTATLPPRQDDLPDFNNIINDIFPLPSLNTCEVPWLNIKDLKSGKAINRLTQFSGLLKNSNIQYVSKNCSSKRWICLSSTDN